MTVFHAHDSMHSCTKATTLSSGKRMSFYTEIIFVYLTKFLPAEPSVGQIFDNSVCNLWTLNRTHLCYFVQVQRENTARFPRSTYMGSVWREHVTNRVSQLLNDHNLPSCCFMLHGTTWFKGTLWETIIQNFWIVPGSFWQLYWYHSQHWSSLKHHFRATTKHIKMILLQWFLFCLGPSHSWKDPSLIS